MKLKFEVEGSRNGRIILAAGHAVIIHRLLRLKYTTEEYIRAEGHMAYMGYMGYLGYSIIIQNGIKYDYFIVMVILYCTKCPASRQDFCHWKFPVSTNIYIPKGVSFHKRLSASSSSSYLSSAKASRMSCSKCWKPSLRFGVIPICCVWRCNKKSNFASFLSFAGVEMSILILASFRQFNIMTRSPVKHPRRLGIVRSNLLRYELCVFIFHYSASSPDDTNFPCPYKSRLAVSVIVFRV